MSAGEAPSCSRFPPAERPAPLLAGPDGRSDGALPHRRSSLVHGTADMAWGAAISALAVTLTIEHLPEPLGLNTLAPRFSWHPAATQLPHSQRGLQQIAYRLQVAESAAALEAGPWLWDTGSVASNRSVLVEYRGAALNPGQPYFVRVKPTYSSHAGGEDGGIPDELQLTSGAARFSTAPAAYTADFIGLPSASPPGPSPGPAPPPAPGPGPASSLPWNQSSCPWLRKQFPLTPTFNPDTDAALVHVGSIGFHELWVNGKKATEDVLSPSVSDLAKRVLVRTYDVAPLLKPGHTNTIGLWLSTGWAGFNSVSGNAHTPHIKHSTRVHDVVCCCCDCCVRDCKLTEPLALHHGDRR